MKPITLYRDSSVPSTMELDQGGAYTMGCRFRPTVDGWATGVRFYRGGLRNIGLHYGHIWDATTQAKLGDTLAFFEGEPLGWQEAPFIFPVRLKANHEYIVSYAVPDLHISVSIYAPGPAPTYVDESPALAFLANCYSEGENVFPSTITPNDYFVDLRFVTEPPRVPWQLSWLVLVPAADPVTSMSGMAAPEQLYTRFDFGVTNPWVVPAGWEFYLTDAYFTSKHIAYYDLRERNSYMHIGNLITITELGNHPNLTTPYLFAQGTSLEVSFQNCAGEAQNMAGFMTGYLAPVGKLDLLGTLER